MSTFHILSLLMFVVFIVVATLVVGSLLRLLRAKTIEIEQRIQKNSDSGV